MGQYQGKDQLPVEVGDQVTCLINKSIWSVHSGTKRVSVLFNVIVI